MFIGVPTETKNQEYRVALTPHHVKSLVDDGHCVAVGRSAGYGSGFTDQDYKDVGAYVVDNETVWNHDIIVKVKEPQPEEYIYFRENHVIFSYLHLAANRKLTEALVDSGACGIAFETILDEDGRTPLLDPMSTIAGRLAPQVAAQFLSTMYGGKGLLISEANVVILGGGTAGTEAAYVAAGMGAHVAIVDLPNKIDYLEENVISHLPEWNEWDNIQMHYTVSSDDTDEVLEQIVDADIVIGCVHVPGTPTEQLITEEMVKEMKSGSIIVDVAIDQGGCSETSRPTTHTDPVYTVHDVIHYCVPNMPGIVPRSASEQLALHIFPYLEDLLDDYPMSLVLEGSLIRSGINVRDGTVCHPAVAKALGM